MRVVAATSPCPSMLLPSPEGTSACCWRLFDQAAATPGPVLQPPPPPQEQQRSDPAAARPPHCDSDSVLSEEHDGDREDDEEQEPGGREGHVPAESRRPRGRLHTRSLVGRIGTEQGHPPPSTQSQPPGQGSGPPTTGKPSERSREDCGAGRCRWEWGDKARSCSCSSGDLEGIKL